MRESGSSQREQSALESRRWVRLTWTCNNRCLFCHDSATHNGQVKPLGDALEEIRKGASDGCQRLVLSGGEPTLHPDFLELVRSGRSQGYSWIQVVTNGRMFAYRDFARKALDAGLDEVTFSLHGHDADLHDRLVGVKGAFAQSLAGMENLHSFGTPVVNIDVVLSAINLPVLPEFMDFFFARGVHEFDLLWLVPFGRAWENRRVLFPEVQKARLILAETIRRARQLGVVLWTNRMPPDLLEDAEDLIQDPHKIHDEVAGRQADFLDEIQAVQPMRCREPERCAWCFLSGFCQRLESVRKALVEGGPIRIRVDLRTPQPQWLASALAAFDLCLVAEAVEPAVAFLGGLRDFQRTTILQLTKPPAGDLSLLRPGDQQSWLRIASGDPATLDSLLETWGGAIEIVLNRETAAWAARHARGLIGAGKRVGFSLETFATASETERLGCDPAEALAPFSGARIRLFDLPPCILSGACLAGNEPEVAAGVLSNSGGGNGAGINLAGFTDDFIIRGYRAHSKRCDSCPVRGQCPGLAINHIRCFGFGVLQPDRFRPAGSLPGSLP